MSDLTQSYAILSVPDTFQTHHRIRIFFTGSQRLGCAILPHRFFTRLAHRDKDQQPHPVLTTAMLLVGSAFTEWTPGYSTAQKHDLPPTCPSIPVLLAKTQAYLTDALSQVDRMLDWLQASILLSDFFFQQGRLAEGEFISATNSRQGQSAASIALCSVLMLRCPEWLSIAISIELIERHFPRCFRGTILRQVRVYGITRSSGGPKVRVPPSLRNDLVPHPYLCRLVRTGNQGVDLLADLVL